MAGDLLILDPMCTHSFKKQLRWRGQLRRPLRALQLAVPTSAIGTTAATSDGSLAVLQVPLRPPSCKFPCDLRESLPSRLRGLLDWELPDEMDQFTAEQQQLMKGAKL